MRKSLVLSFLACAALILASVGAMAAQPYDAKSFQSAQAAGKTILIDVWASWCPVCMRQKPILAQIQKERPNLVVFEVNFDTEKELLRRLQVQRQSTLIVYKGDREFGRSVGDTDPERIRALVAKGL